MYGMCTYDYVPRHAMQNSISSTVGHTEVFNTVLI